MLVKHIHAYALERLKYLATLLTIVIILFTILASYLYTNKGSELNYKTEAQTLQSQLGDIKNKINISTAAINEWEKNVRKKHLSRDGLQVDFVKILVKKLEGKYRVRGVNAVLSNPELRKDFTDNAFTNIQVSNISLAFVAYIDTDAYNFIDEFIKEMPGYLQVKNASFVGVNEINEEILMGIERGDTRDIVSVKVDLLWQDFQDKPEIAAEIKAKMPKSDVNSGASSTPQPTVAGANSASQIVAPAEQSTPSATTSPAPLENTQSVAPVQNSEANQGNEQ